MIVDIRAIPCGAYDQFIDAHMPGETGYKENGLSQVIRFQHLCLLFIAEGIGPPVDDGRPVQDRDHGPGIDRRGWQGRDGIPSEHEPRRAAEAPSKGGVGRGVVEDHARNQEDHG